MAILGRKITSKITSYITSKITNVFTSKIGSILGIAIGKYLCYTCYDRNNSEKEMFLFFIAFSFF